MTNDPWYTRTEFWASLATHIVGITSAFFPGASLVVQGVGMTLGMAAPLVYTFGRSNVKVAQAAAAMNAAGGALTAQPAAK